MVKRSFSTISDNLLKNKENKFLRLKALLRMNNNDNILHLNVLIFNSGNRKNRIVDDMCQKVNTCSHRTFSNRKNYISKTLSQIHEAKAIILLGQNDRLIFAKRILLDDLFKELDDLILSYDSKVTEYNLSNIYKSNN